ncbi:DUF6119 family protein [Caulobacter sp. 1776]|uniref:DUF6119 family protein n=1 Tax=Caulobacter sp. 1776 TaxID=3156420 RepID=UPI003394BC4B
MKKKKLASRPFSIFLLKKGFDEKNSLNDGAKLARAKANKLPPGASVFILDGKPREPWWKNHFDIEWDLNQVGKGALIFLPVMGRYFALSFGNVYHHLKDVSYEYDFGLLVTLNCLNPKEVKSADMVAPGASRRKRTQVPNSTDLTYLDFDGNSEIIKSLTGAVKPEYENLFQNVTGSVSLKVNLRVSPGEMPNLCGKLLDLYDSDDYKEAFPNIANISPVRDPDDVAELEKLLVGVFGNPDDNFAISIPDIVDYGSDLCVRFHIGSIWSDVYSEVSIDSLYDFLGEDFDFSVVGIDYIKNLRMVLTDADGYPTASYSLYRSLVTDVQWRGTIHHLCEGRWYRVEADFLVNLKEYIDHKCKLSELISYNHDSEKDGVAIYSEENYNKAVCIADSRYICLDRTDIKPSGSTEIEPCDLFIVDAGQSRAKLLHMKISTKSASLSHLFNQGVNSIELLKANKNSKSKLKKLIEDNIGDNDLNLYLSPIESGLYEVIFGVITRLDAGKKSENLPLFSKMSLKRSMERLDLMEVPNALVFVSDESERKGSRPKNPSILVEIFDDGAGKIEVRPRIGQPGYDPSEVVKKVPKDVREAPVGSRFRLEVRRSGKGDLSSYHTWKFEPV